MRALLLSCAVAVTSAWADSSVHLSGTEAQVDLKSGAAVPANGDLVLHAGAVSAAGGLRPADATEWADSAPLSLGARWIARDARGETYEVRVRSIDEASVWLDIAALKKEPRRRGPHFGTFKLSHWSLNGAPAEPVMPALTLKAEGDYLFGGAKGRWSYDEGGLSLLGPYAHWGCAKLRANGDELVFDYTRGMAHFEVVLTREAEPPAQAQR